MAKKRAPGQYVALLRGINVGGNNVIKMTELKACFEALKLERVQTYIQSGNVLFEAAETDATTLTQRIEGALSKSFGYEARIVLRTHRQLEAIVARAPDGFGAQPEERRYDVIFLLQPLTPAKAVKAITVNEGVDEVFVGPGVLYFSRLIAKASQSRLTRIVGTPIYQDMTIRNWNTTTKLLGLLAGRAAGSA